jgi:hypothetical protein
VHTRSATFGALALIATTLTGCSSDGGGSWSTAADDTCSSYGDFNFGGVRQNPTLTRASVVTVTASGTHSARVPGLKPTITPSAKVASGPRPNLSVVLTKFKSTTFLYPIPGPSAAPAPTAKMPRGTWVTYAGVDIYEINYTTTCFDTTPPTPMSGTVTAWADPRGGTINCADPYLDDLLASIAVAKCPNS